MRSSLFFSESDELFFGEKNMNIICKPCYLGNKIVVGIDVIFDAIDKKINSFFSITVKLTRPNGLTEMIANNDVYPFCMYNENCHYSAELSIDLSGKYIITAKAFSNGRFLGVQREVFYIECSDQDCTVLRDPSICWREEDKGMVSVLDHNGNLFFLKGRLKNIWLNANGDRNIDSLISITGIDSNEIQKLTTILKNKKILIGRKKIKFIMGGDVYEFD